MLVGTFIYSGLSLLNQFFCDSAIIDKTLFYGITILPFYGYIGLSQLRNTYQHERNS